MDELVGPPDLATGPIRPPVQLNTEAHKLRVELFSIGRLRIWKKDGALGDIARDSGGGAGGQEG